MECLSSKQDDTIEAWPNTEMPFSRGGIINETYHAVNAFMNRISRDEGIDWALNYEGKKIDALLQPSGAYSEVDLQI